MNTYAPEMMESDLVDVSFISPHPDGQQMSYRFTDAPALASSVKSDSFYMGKGLDDHDLYSDGSVSFSGLSSQSLSPQPHNGFPISQLPDLSLSSSMLGTNSGMISPNESASSRKDSIEDEHRAERRKAQNRAAQRAYRQRKDHSLRQREKEVASLREELDKAQRLNKTLSKVVALLRERLKEPNDADVS